MPDDLPLQWSQDGRSVYTVANVSGARPAAVEVFRVELWRQAAGRFGKPSCRRIPSASKTCGKRW